MDKDILKGIKISFGFVLFLVTILSLSYAGYHGANQVISGTFLGNYIFQNNVTFQNDVNFTDANISNFNIENRINDPISPDTGRIWLRTDI